MNFQFKLCLLEKKTVCVIKHINKTRDFPVVMKGLIKAVQRMNTGWGPWNLSRQLLLDSRMSSFVSLSLSSIKPKPIYFRKKKKKSDKSKGMNQKGARKTILSEHFINRVYRSTAVKKALCVHVKRVPT